MLKRIPKDFLQVYAFNISAKVIQFLISVVLIRNMPNAEEYALYTQFYTLATALSGIVGDSLSLAYVRYNTEQYSKNPQNDVDRLFLIIQIINTVLFGMILTGTFIWLLVTAQESSYLIQAITAGFLFSALALEISYFRSREKYMVSGLIENVRYIAVAVILGGIFLLDSLQYSNIVLAYILALIITIVIGILLIRRSCKTRNAKITLNFDAVKLLFSVSIWLILYNAVMQALNQVDVSMLSAFGESYDVACYGVAFKYYSILMGFMPAIKTVLRVRMSKADKIESIQNQHLFAKSWLIKSSLPVLLFAAAGGVAGYWILPVINGNNYNEASSVFLVLCFCAAFAYIFAPATSLIMSIGKYKMQFVTAVIAMLINIIGNYILIPKWGAVGAALTTTISHLFFNGTLTLLIFRQKGNDIGLQKKN